MSDNVYAQINDRSKLIFKKLVESYLKTGLQQDQKQL